MQILGVYNTKDLLLMMAAVLLLRNVRPGEPLPAKLPLKPWTAEILAMTPAQHEITFQHITLIQQNILALQQAALRLAIMEHIQQAQQNPPAAMQPPNANAVAASCSATCPTPQTALL